MVAPLTNRSSQRRRASRLRVALLSLLFAAGCATPKSGADAAAGQGGGGNAGSGAGGTSGASGSGPGAGGAGAGGNNLGSGGNTASGGDTASGGNTGSGGAGGRGRRGRNGRRPRWSRRSRRRGGDGGILQRWRRRCRGQRRRLPPAPVWGWTGVVGTGQSLAVGGHGNAPAMTIGATTQPFHNLKLSLGSATVPPFTPTNAALSMVPLVEPLRTITTTYPSPYPANIYGESFHTAMGDELTSLAMSAGKADFVSTQTEVGEAGQPISVIQKGATDTGTTGRAYAASLFEVAAIARLAKAQGKSYGVGAILLTHGESDAASATFESDMVTLWTNYNHDLPPLTGQTFAIPMLLSQQHSNPTDAGSTSLGTLAQWKIGVDHPGDIICTGPKYQYAYVNDYTHLINKDYERLGEKDAQVFYQRVVLGNAWQPLQPTGASRSGRVITVSFNVPVAPLAWDTSLPMPHQASNTAWAQGKGFEVSNGATPITISGVAIAIAGNSVQITVASDLPASGVTVAYAFTADAAPRANGTVRWGLLHDSDPFVGYLSGMPGQNYAVAFQLNVP